MKILAIETSCDDTGIAILEAKKTGNNTQFKILANKIHTQLIHADYGGVFPMMAKREHGKNMIPTIESALKEAKMLKSVKNKKINEKLDKKIKEALDRENDLGSVSVKFLNSIKKPDINAIAVTVGPGLEPALWVGISMARALSIAWGIPIIPVNHMEGHVLSILVQKKKTFIYNKKTLQFPVLSLLVSGGHTELVLMKNFGKYKIIGQTLDDAAGEAFDKVARMLGLPYPGGPEISKLAETERRRVGSGSLTQAVEPSRENFQQKIIRADGTNTPSEVKLPRPMIYSKDFNFSFSGLKTAVLYYIRDNGPLTEKLKSEIAKEFEDSAIEVLTTKTIKAAKTHKVKNVIVGGGVSANTYLQKTLKKKLKELGKNIPLHLPTKALSTDNALMIAIAGYFQYQKKKPSKNTKKLKAVGNLPL